MAGLTARPMAIRIRQVCAGFCACLAILALRSAAIMVVHRSEYVWYDTKIGGASLPVPAAPGGVYDRAGQPLARTLAAAAIWADPTLIRNADERVRVAQALQAQRGLPATDLFQLLGQAKQFVYLERSVPPEEAERVRRLRLPGIGVLPELTRVYPRGSLAAHVLGWRRHADQACAGGVEWYWRSLLNGRPGLAPRNVDAYGRPVIGAEAASSVPPEPGKSLVLTLDAGVQGATERALDRLIAKWHPAWGATATVLDVKTGDILAMASRPTFDPNHYEQFTKQDFINTPVSRAYEPGSVLKLILVASALNAGAIGPSDTVYCGGSITVAGRERHCWGRYATRGHGTLDIAGVLANSCNVGAMKIVPRLGREKYLKALRAFHFGERPWSGLPGEATGKVPPEESVHAQELASLAFGHNIAVSDLQLLAAVAALANHGVMMRPHILREVRTADGKTFYRYQPQVIGQPVTAKTADTVLRMMGQVVQSGTGRLAAIEGVRVGGKTATAVKLEHGKYVDAAVV